MCSVCSKRSPHTSPFLLKLIRLNSLGFAVEHSYMLLLFASLVANTWWYGLYYEVMARCAPSISLCAAFAPICPTRGLALTSRLLKGIDSIKAPACLNWLAKSNETNCLLMVTVCVGQCRSPDLEKKIWQGWKKDTLHKQKLWDCILVIMSNVRPMVLLVGLIKLSPRGYSMDSVIH